MSERTFIASGVFAWVLLIHGCGSGPGVEQGDGAKSKWTGLAFNWNRLDVYIQPGNDTLYWFDDTRTTYRLEGRDSTVGKLYKAQLVINPAERDSILALATEIVFDAARIDDWVSCMHCEYARIRLTAGPAEISLAYNSVPSWLDLSPKHGRLKAMTFGRFDSIPKTLVESYP